MTHIKKSMNKEPRTIEQLFESARNDHAVPSREDFRALLGRVTENAANVPVTEMDPMRNTWQRGRIRSPFASVVRHRRTFMASSLIGAALSLVLFIGVSRVNAPVSSPAGAGDGAAAVTTYGNADIDADASLLVSDLLAEADNDAHLSDAQPDEDMLALPGDTDMAQSVVDTFY